MIDPYQARIVALIRAGHGPGMAARLAYEEFYGESPRYEPAARDWRDVAAREAGVPRWGEI